MIESRSGARGRYTYLVRTPGLADKLGKVGRVLDDQQDLRDLRPRKFGKRPLTPPSWAEVYRDLSRYEKSEFIRRLNASIRGGIASAGGVRDPRNREWLASLRRMGGETGADFFISIFVNPS